MGHAQTSRNVSGVGRIGGATMGGLASGDSSLTTEVVSNTNESEEELQRSLIESFYYLGENSEFVNVDENYTPPATVETPAAEQLNASFANDPSWLCCV